MRGYLATVDSPCCDLYAELMTIYPNAKVILSVRDSDEQWWQSFTNTAGVQLKLSFQILTYPLTFIRKQQYLYNTMMERWRALPGVDGELGPKVHSAHGKLVRETVPRERLLEFNNKMGWPKLCGFLDVPIPDVPFPNM